MHSATEIIASKRDGHELSESQLAWFIHELLDGRVADYQATALLMAISIRGMTPPETASLTRVMLASGTRLDWLGHSRRIVDKHSTGGIGDKVSLILAPLLATFDLAVPMISGRGLGPTGGTLDKLESIPGFRCDLALGEITAAVDEVGCVITGATPEIAPADQVLYALRDVTATVASIPLITASILSKKLAASLECLLLDVKFGSGAFMPTLPAARELADSLVRVGNLMGTQTRAILTNMNQPLGRMIGNALEVQESLDVLQGQGPADLVELVVAQAIDLLIMAGIETSVERAGAQVRSRLASGAAYEKFAAMIGKQGGQLNAFQATDSQTVQAAVVATEPGFVSRIACSELGYAVIDLGGGRKRADDQIDPFVGIEFLARVGVRVEPDQELAIVTARNDRSLQQAMARIDSAITRTLAPCEPLQLIAGRIDDRSTWHAAQTPDPSLPRDEV